MCESTFPRRGIFLKKKKLLCVNVKLEGKCIIHNRRGEWNILLYNLGSCAYLILHVKFQRALEHPFSILFYSARILQIFSLSLSFTNFRTIVEN